MLVHDHRGVLNPEEHGALRSGVLHLVLELAGVVGAVLFQIIGLISKLLVDLNGGCTESRICLTCGIS